MREIGHHTALQKASGSQQGATIQPAARRLWQMSCIIQKALYSCQLSAEMGISWLTQVELHKAAAVVDQAGRDAAREADAVGGERAEGAARQLAQAPLQGRERGDQGPGQPRVVVQVQVAQALGIRQGAEDVQSRALRTDLSDLAHCVEHAREDSTLNASQPNHSHSGKHEITVC